MAGVMLTAGKNLMCDGLSQHSGLQLVAVESTTVIAREDVTFDSAATGVSDITGDVALTIVGNHTVNSVYLVPSAQEITAGYCYATLDSDNVFPNGGDLIVESFELTVT